MRLLTGDFTQWGPVQRPSAVTIGVFDGVHRGHQTILEHLQTEAAGDEVGVVTFSEHPAKVLRPESAPAMLTSLEQRLELFAGAGVDTVAVLDFAQVRPMDPEAFVAEILVAVMRARHIAVGEEFRFGHRMAGDVQLLESLGAVHGFTVEVIPIVGDNQPVRSTAIRQALGRGDMPEVTRMLGRLFEVRGSVVMGDHRGRQLGFPTANLEMAEGQALPARGVYSAWVIVAGGSRHAGVVNIGVRPTFGAGQEVVEVHLLDGEHDLYGQELRVGLVSAIRGERRFSGVDELVEQIGRDVGAARRDLSSSA